MRADKLGSTSPAINYQGQSKGPRTWGIWTRAKCIETNSRLLGPFLPWVLVCDGARSSFITKNRCWLTRNWPIWKCCLLQMLAIYRCPHAAGFYGVCIEYLINTTHKIGGWDWRITNILRSWHLFFKVTSTAVYDSWHVHRACDIDLNKHIFVRSLALTQNIFLFYPWNQRLCTGCQSYKTKSVFANKLSSHVMNSYSRVSPIILD